MKLWEINRFAGVNSYEELKRIATRDEARHIVDSYDAFPIPSSEKLETFPFDLVKKANLWKVSGIRHWYLKNCVKVQLADGLYRYDHEGSHIVGFGHYGVPIELSRWGKKQSWSYNMSALGNTMSQDVTNGFKIINAQAKKENIKDKLYCFPGNFRFTFGAKTTTMRYVQWPLSPRGTQLSTLILGEDRAIYVYSDKRLYPSKLRRIGTTINKDPAPTYRNLNNILVLNDFMMDMDKNIPIAFFGKAFPGRKSMALQENVLNRQFKTDSTIRHEQGHIVQDYFLDIVDSNGLPLFGSGKYKATTDLSETDFFGYDAFDKEYLTSQIEDVANSFETGIRLWEKFYLPPPTPTSNWQSLVLRLLFDPHVRPGDAKNGFDLFKVDKEPFVQRIAKMVPREKAQKKLWAVAEYFHNNP